MGHQSGGPSPHLRRLGEGRAGALGVPPKAALLDRAAAAGLPVPDGLVVREPALTALPAEVLAAQVAEVAPADLVAVRSAFAGEDADAAANAGRFATVLGVDAADTTALCAAIRMVVGSAGPDDGPLALLVQAMVPAVAAGVAFTEPDHEDDLVDVVPGLADGLVAGRVPGDRTTLPRLVAGERPAGVGWRPRLQALLRDVRRVLGDDVGWDVEWADDGERTWLVQARRITAAPRRDEALTLANHREILPDPPSRLMTSLVLEAAPGTFGYWRSFARDLPSDRPFVAEVAGRPLINLSLLADSMRRLGLPTSFVTDSMGGSAADDVVPPVGPRPLRLVRHLPALVGLGVDQLRSPGDVPDRVAALRERAGRPGDGFGGAVEAATDVYVGLLHGMFALSTAVAGPLAVLGATGTSAEHHARHRSAGTRAWDDLAPLHRLVDADPERREAVEAGRVPDDEEFRAAWRTWLDEHGHRGVHESDLANPRYREDPSAVLAMLGSPDRPASVPDRTLAGRLTTPVWWQASRAIRAREDLRSGAMRAFEVLRHRFLDLAADAAADGLLPDPAAVFDCTVDELRGVDAGVPVTAEHLSAVRAEREGLARLRLPDVVRSSDDPEAWDPAAAPPPADRLEGLPLSHGEVVGTVWRLDAPSSGAVPHAGPVVLVAPAVDAGWMTVFARVDAVVVETGGELSHGSIVLRERGVPAVTNVAGATRLADGERVRVRAHLGTVDRLAGADGDR